MPHLTFLWLLCFSLFLQKPTSAQTCPSSCPGGESGVKFPFGLNPDGNRNGRCSYPGFGLSCSNKTGALVLKLPKSGEFTVRFINYETQQIWINDPDFCLPKRFMESFDISGTPFVSEVWHTLTFFNCSTGAVAEAGLRRIRCLSNDNYSVVAYEIESFMDSDSGLPSTCHSIKTVTVPFAWYGWAEGVRLEWYKPDCRSCVERRGDCGFKNRASQEIGCFNLPSQAGLPRSAKYGITIGVGIPGLLCLIGLVSFVGSRVRAYARQRNLPSTEFSTSISPLPAAIITGLDGPTIESYPKTKLGDSGRLPKPNDNTCPICLSEYQPKETLRTIPECNHYFHANCIDAWLKMNASCPLCRNSPGGSAPITPSISSSSSSSSSSLLSA
ncbi:PREDICTED: RING-H2 finger protein ATL20 [Theobroma cacao]|uniref:RING-type E3 ubiquitin transferase n=1 Tax=Theobroma cacao TaxID=3641 RepID=A0AB32VD31_THECC|nr:PREDICTED: RING-H2 finger protein ATL20 [Theobroma cacao]